MAKRKPGKYDHIIAGLPAIPLEDDPRRQERIERLKENCRHCGKPQVEHEAPGEFEHVFEAWKDLDALHLTIDYALIKFELDAKNEEASALQLKLDTLKQLLIASEDAGTDPAWGAYGANDNALRLPDGSSLRVNKELSSKVVDPDKFQEWCIANGYKRKLQLHASTRDAIVAERALAIEPMPDGIEIGSWSKVTFTPAKGE
jgi:hypothetical protein